MPMSQGQKRLKTNNLFISQPIFKCNIYVNGFSFVK